MELLYCINEFLNFGSIFEGKRYRVNCIANFCVYIIPLFGNNVHTSRKDKKYINNKVYKKKLRTNFIKKRKVWRFKLDKSYINSFIKQGYNKLKLDK